MTGLRDRLFKPSARYDVELASTRGFLAGVFQAGLHLIGLGALVWLAIAAGAVGPVTWAQPPDSATLVSAGLAGGLVGAGMIGLATTERIKRTWRTPAGRLLTVLGLYAGFWWLLLAAFFPAVAAGLGYLAGRVLAHTGMYLRSID